MTEHPLHSLDVGFRADRQARGSMPEVVDRDAWEVLVDGL